MSAPFQTTPPFTIAASLKTRKVNIETMNETTFAMVTVANNAVNNGIGLGSAIAVVCSWQRNRSILWAILAGIFSWLYVIYFAITRKTDEGRN